MKSLFVILCAAALVVATPAIAKKKHKPQGERGSGAYCYAGADSLFVPGASFSPKVRNSLRKGERIKIRISGYGPATCVVY